MLILFLFCLFFCFVRMFAPSQVEGIGALSFWFDSKSLVEVHGLWNALLNPICFTPGGPDPTFEHFTGRSESSKGCCLNLWRTPLRRHPAIRGGFWTEQEYVA